MATSKCTYIFAAINRSQKKIKPIMLYATAIDEKSARQRYVADYILLFAGRLPVTGGCHVQTH
ncbi:host cell division inhibitor Icd-like protein [Candidatus Regiella endosymbiont of Tuberolachnus salignus]|uniref:host cell division inhibitor Icd-like protein n=1 Tax=Candidatus Regiella endosymbiont of Tuberolachnus salignus TaxID=3077956 RepID=UPI0030D48440